MTRPGEARGLVGAAPAQLAALCARCGVVHLQANHATLAVAALTQLFSTLETGPAHAADRDHLRASNGKMLGVLVGVRDGQVPVTLRAFSGDLGGEEEQPGWAPALVRRRDTAPLQAATSAAIGALEEQMRTASTPAYHALRAQRREASQHLMAAMIDAVVLQSRGGARTSLRAAFSPARPDGPKRIPSGTADCVLPKLLHAAHVQGIAVQGVAEAWWGPPQGARVHGALQLPCAARCRPILGFLLCPVP